jgi:F-box/leucine-rich repeat protein 7
MAVLIVVIIDKKNLNMLLFCCFALSGPLLIGSSLLCFIGVAPMLFTGQAVARFATNASLYGGLVIFSGFLMYDTQVAIVRAENAKSEDELDEINESLSITLDILNIFMKILQIYLEEENRKRKRRF